METIFKEEKIEVVQKRSEDNISTSNPKAKLPCDKKITNVYMAKKKSVMVLEDESANLQEVKKNYIALTSLNVEEKYRLPRPSELDIGSIITIENEVNVGDNGQHLVVPLKRKKHATLTKEIELEETQELSVGDSVHLVTEVEGFKKGESVLTKINEEDKITKSDELLTVTQHDKAKKEFIGIVEENEDNPSKGVAVSEEVIVRPPMKEKEENNTVSVNEKNWKENFEEIEDASVTLKVKVSSSSLPNEDEVESEEVKLEKRRSSKISLDYMRSHGIMTHMLEKGGRHSTYDETFGEEVAELVPLYIANSTLYEERLIKVVDKYGKRLKKIDYTPKEIRHYKWLRRTNLEHRVKLRTRNVRKDDYVEGFGVSLDVGIGLVEGTAEIGIFIGQKRVDGKINRYCGYYRAAEGGFSINLNHLSNAETHLKDMSEQLNEKKMRNKLGAAGSLTFVDGRSNPFDVFKGTYTNVSTYFGPFSHSTLSNDPDKDGVYDNEIADTWDFQLFGTWSIGTSAKMGIGTVFWVRESKDYGKTWHDYVFPVEHKNEN